MEGETYINPTYVTSRKRPYLDLPPFMDLPPLPFQFTTSFESNDQLRFQQSQAATTSAIPIDNYHLFSYFHHSDMQFDADILHLQETWKRRCRDMILATGQQVIRRLIEKESELQNAKRRHIQLEEELTQIHSEIYVWFNAAKNNESIAAALQTELDQAILTVAERSGGCNGIEAEDAQSCCVEASEEFTDVASRQQRVCRRCEGKNASVLLLPCRHLCLCKECEPVTTTCPLCCSVKNASLEISFC